jgi:hypothetical protein
MVLPFGWRGGDWVRLLLQFVVAGAVALRTRGETRKVFLSAILAGVLLLGVALAATAGQNILLTQLQLWRAQWVIAALANAGFGYLLLRLWQESALRIPALVLLAGAPAWLLFWEVSLFLTLAAAALLYWDHIRAVQARIVWLDRLAVVTGVVMAGILLSFDARVAVKDIELTDHLLRGLVAPAARLGVLEVVLAAALGRFLFARSRTAALAAALAVLVWGLTIWDRRSPWQRHYENASSAPAELVAGIAPGQQVLWLDGIKETWLFLRRPSYYSSTQGAGLLFSRANALEFRNRFSHLSAFYPEGDNNLHPDSMRVDPRPVVDRATLSSACRQAPELAAIVASADVPGMKGSEWRAPVNRLVKRWSGGDWIVDREDTYRLYLCAGLRQPARGAD